MEGRTEKREQWRPRSDVCKTNEGKRALFRIALLRYAQRVDRFDQMEAFLRVLEAGGFTSAAQSLGVGKSAISRRVSELEARLGVQLLRRGTRRLDPTVEGEAFAARASAILAELAEAESSARAGSGALSGNLRISIPLSFGLARLASVLSDFARLNPGLTMNIDVTDRRVDLAREGVDLAVRIGAQLPDSSLRARKIATCEMWATASPAFLEAYGHPTTPAELARLPEIRYGLRERSTWRVSTPDGETEVVDMHCAHRVGNGDFAAEMAARGLGVSVQPDFILERFVDSGALARVMADHAFPGLSVWAVWPEVRYESARLRALVDALAAADLTGALRDV